jgi:two-component system OmpR family response regulator
VRKNWLLSPGGMGRENSSVPVVIVSAWSDESTRRRAAACGVREYLVKPFNPEDLMAAIRRHIEAVRDAN